MEEEEGEEEEDSEEEEEEEEDSEAEEGEDQEECPVELWSVRFGERVIERTGELGAEDSQSAGVQSHLRGSAHVQSNGLHFQKYERV